MTTHDQHTDDRAMRGDDFVPEDQVAPTDPAAADHDAGHTASSQDSALGGATTDGSQTDVRHETSGESKLFADDELAGLRARWNSVQAGFVDDPKDCVQKADSLVADLVEQLTTGFGQARSRLEEQWSRGEQASTEDLRVALMRYRSFFERLLSV